MHVAHGLHKNPIFAFTFYGVSAAVDARIDDRPPLFLINTTNTLVPGKKPTEWNKSVNETKTRKKKTARRNERPHNNHFTPLMNRKRKIKIVHKSILCSLAEKCAPRAHEIACVMQSLGMHATTTYCNTFRILFFIIHSLFSTVASALTRARARTSRTHTTHWMKLVRTNAFLTVVKKHSTDCGYVESLIWTTNIYLYQ